MKDAMWAVDPVQGVHYRDPRDPSQMMLDFDLHPNFESLRRALLAQLLHGEHTLAQLQDYAVRETIYRGPHVTRALPQMITDQLAERHPPAGQLTKQTRIRMTVRGREYLATEQRPSSDSGTGSSRSENGRLRAASDSERNRDLA
jgi:hypothetical protein